LSVFVAYLKKLVKFFFIQPKGGENNLWVRRQDPLQRHGNRGSWVGWRGTRPPEGGREELPCDALTDEPNSQKIQGKENQFIGSVRNGKKVGSVFGRGFKQTSPLGRIGRASPLPEGKTDRGTNNQSPPSSVFWP